MKVETWKQLRIDAGVSTIIRKCDVLKVSTRKEGKRATEPVETFFWNIWWEILRTQTRYGPRTSAARGWTICQSEVGSNHRATDVQTVTKEYVQRGLPCFRHGYKYLGWEKKLNEDSWHCETHRNEDMITRKMKSMQRSSCHQSHQGKGSRLKESTTTRVRKADMRRHLCTRAPGLRDAISNMILLAPRNI